MRETSLLNRSAARVIMGTIAPFAAVFFMMSALAAGQGFPLSIEGPREICVGETGVYRAVSNLGTGYSWEVKRGTIVSGQNSNTISVEWRGATTDTITVFAVSTAGEPMTTSIVVKVYGIAKPIIQPDGPTTICLGSSVMLWAPEGYASYRWSNGSTALSLRVSDAGTFTVTVTNAHGCTATSPPVSVDILLPPEPAISALGPSTFCEGESVVLDAGEGFVGYEWSTGEGTRFITATQSGAYRVTVRSIYGCRATSPQFVVTVLPRPAKPTIIRGGTTLIASSGAAYQWYRAGALIPGATDQRLEAPGSGVYTVRVANQFGCYTESDPFPFAYASMIVAVPAMNVDLHRTLNLPLIITESENLESISMLSFTAKVRFDRDALYPQDNPSVVSGNDRIVSVSGTYARGDTVLAVIPCTPMWSDIAKTTVTIDSLTFFDEDVYVQTQPGTLNFLLCNEGGTRLFLGTGAMTLAQNHPNPFNATTNIEYSVFEEGRTLLAVYNMLGRRVATLVDAAIPPGSYRVPFDAEALPSGLYMYVLRTPSDQITKLMELVK